MSASLVANVTVNGSVTVQGPYANVQYMNATSMSSLLTFSAATGLSIGASIVAGGFYHTAVLLANGTVQTFGANSYGQLGVNDTVTRSTPVQVWAISSSAIAVACGQLHTAVLLANGTVQTFGRNSQGQLGVNDTAQRNIPVRVWAISSSAIAVACGRYHTAILLANGTVQTFGRNDNGQLGVNDTVTRSTPVQVLNIPLATGFSFNGPVFNGPLGIGLAPSVYQLDMASDTARKLSTSTWFTGSDERIKKNIETANLARCAEIVDSLDLKYFEWISNVGSTDQHSLGWIAQDVQQFFPKSVTTGSGYDLDDFHTLNSDQLIKVLYGAIKQTLIEYFPRTE